MTVRVLGPPDRGVPDAPAAASGAGFLRARREQLRHLPPEAAVIRQELAGLAAAERMEAGAGRLRLTVFHLVDRSAIAAYRRRASKLQEKLQPHVVRVTGPWPAFAFAPELF
jgi:hypothetical protein